MDLEIHDLKSDSDSSENNMAELKKLSTYQLDDLPEEVILKILGFLDIKELLLCGQVSQRFRAISNDGSLWQKLKVQNSHLSSKQKLEKTLLMLVKTPKHMAQIS